MEANGRSADEDLSTGAPGVGVDQVQLPRVTAPRDAGPNPARGAPALACDLSGGAEGMFDVLDVAGRVVATRPPESVPAGSWTRSWDAFGTSSSGPGVCFPGMRAHGRKVGGHELVRLPRRCKGPGSKPA